MTSASSVPLPAGFVASGEEQLAAGSGARDAGFGALFLGALEDELSRRALLKPGQDVPRDHEHPMVANAARKPRQRQTSELVKAVMDGEGEPFGALEEKFMGRRGLLE